MKMNKEKLEQRYLPIKLVTTRDANESRIIEGYIAKFNDWTNIGGEYGWDERISPGAFKDALIKDDILQLRDHDWGKILGKNGINLELKEDVTGLHFKLDVPRTPLGDETLELVRTGIIGGCSFGAYVDGDAWEFKDDKAFRTINKCDLLEVTLTPIPAYPTTTAFARDKVKSLKESNENVDLDWEKRKKEIIDKYSKK